MKQLVLSSCFVVLRPNELCMRCARWAIRDILHSSRLISDSQGSNGVRNGAPQCNHNGGAALVRKPVCAEADMDARNGANADRGAVLDGHTTSAQREYIRCENSADTAPCSHV